MEKNAKNRAVTPALIFIVLGAIILALGILKYFSSPVIFILLGIVIFSAGIVRCLSLPVIAILAGIIIFNIGIVQYVSYLEERYNCMLNNTIRLADNLTANFSSLETDKMIKELMSKIYVLRMENDTLKTQARKFERELISVSQREKNCQIKLDRMLGRSPRPSRQASKGNEEKAVTPKGSAVGNKGFLFRKN